jgi:hypothetical protein
MILIVSYDLKEIRDYTQFYETLKIQGSWSHYLSTTWLISTTRTPLQVVDALRPYMGQTDFLLVGEFGSNYSGWLPKEAWDWIKAQTQPALPGFGPILPAFIASQHVSQKNE